MRPAYTKISLVGRTNALIFGMSITNRSQSLLSSIFSGLLLSGLYGRNAELVLALGFIDVRASNCRSRSRISAAADQIRSASGIESLCRPDSLSLGHIAAVTKFSLSSTETRRSHTRLSVCTLSSSSLSSKGASAWRTSSNLDSEYQPAVMPLSAHVNVPLLRPCHLLLLAHQEQPPSCRGSTLI